MALLLQSGIAQHINIAMLNARRKTNAIVGIIKFSSSSVRVSELPIAKA